MAVMQQQIQHGKWIRVETIDGTDFVPIEFATGTVKQFLDAVEEGTAHTGDYQQTVACDLLDYLNAHDANDVCDVSPVEGFGARLSAPGYLDCTDWAVFKTEQAAQTYLDDTFGE